MKKKHSGPQIVAKLRQADILIGQGKTIPEVCKEIDVTDATYYRWRQKYGGMSPDMVKQLRAVQKENAQLKRLDVVEVLRYLFAVRGEPDYIRSDNGPEFVSRAVTKWLEHAGVETLFVSPGSPWENGYVESFHEKLRNELLNRELFLHIDELRYVVDRWRMDYNHYRPHSSLAYMAPAAFAATAA